MAYYGVTNTTATPRCTYSTDLFIESASDICGRYIKPLQVCPTKDVTPAVRLEAASQVSLCMHSIWDQGWASNGLNTSTQNTSFNLAPVTVEKDPECAYPDFLPILQKTCAFDLDHFDDTCNATTSGLSERFDYTACQQHAAIQYVRCTLQKDADEVENCVSRNAVKVDWLDQLQTYTGAKSCTRIILYLVIQVLHNLRHIIGSLLSVLLLPVVIRSTFQKWSSRKRSRQTPGFEMAHHGDPTKGEAHVTERGVNVNDVPEGTPISPWTREKRYTLKATRMLQTMGRELLTAYLTFLVLDQSKVFRGASFGEEVSFYLIRPRPAPFYGILGFFVPWSQKALAELVVDGILSFGAGTNVASRFWHLVNKPPADPAAPAGDLKTLAVGAIMMCIPAFTVLAITFLISMGYAAVADDSSSSRRKKKDGDGWAWLVAGLCIWAMQLLLIGLFICALPLIAIIEMLASTIITIRNHIKRRKDRNNNPTFADSEDSSWTGVMQRARSKWEEPLTTESRRFRVMYVLFVFASFIINVGNWVFFGMYLTIEGEMFCPAKVDELVAVWILVPLGIDMFFFAFRMWTGEIVFWEGTSYAVAV